MDISLLPDFLRAAAAAELKQQMLNNLLAELMGVKLPALMLRPEQPKGTDKDIEDIRRFIARQEGR